MKNIIKSLLAVLVLFFAACSQDHTSTIFDPAGESANEIYFVSEAISLEFEATETSHELIVDVYRANATGDLEVQLGASFSSDAESFITVPATALFKDGDYKSEVAVKIDNISNFTRGVTYQVMLAQIFPDAAAVKKLDAGDKSLSAADVSFKYPSITISATLKLEWEPVYILKDWNNLFVDASTLTDDDYVLDAAGKKQIQTGIFTYDDLVFAGKGEHAFERAKGTNVFRMTDWGGGVSVILNVDLETKFTDENGVAHPTFTTPLVAIGASHSSYGPYYIQSMATYQSAKDWADYGYSTVHDCYFDVQKGIFHCYFVYCVGAGFFGVGGIDYGDETFALNSGIVVYDYATAAEYKGMSVGPDNASADAHFAVTTGKDATGFSYAFVEGDVSKDFASVAEALVAGTQEGAVSVAELGEKGVTEFTVKELESGQYTLVVVAHDKDEKATLDGASAIYFYFPGLGGGAKECEFTATVGSYEALGLEFVDGVGDWSAVAIEFASEDLKSLVYAVGSKATIDEYLASEGASVELLLSDHGQALTDEQLAALASAGSVKVPFTGLAAETEQCVVALGTNSFGKTLVVTATGSTVAYPAYSGKVKPGIYKLSCPWVSESTGNSGVDEATLTILPVKGYKNRFVIGDMLTAAPQSVYWNAYYDEATETLTVDGTLFGNEGLGPLWGKVYNIFVYDAAGTYLYAYFAGDDTNGTEFSMKIDEEGKPTSIAEGKGITILLIAAATGQQVTYYQWTSAGTTIAPYVAEGEGGAETSAVKSVNIGDMVQIPFSSVKFTR